MVSEAYKSLRRSLMYSVRERIQWTKEWYLRGKQIYAAGNLDFIYDSLEKFTGQVNQTQGRSFLDQISDFGSAKRTTKRIKGLLAKFLDDLPEVKAA